MPAWVKESRSHLERLIDEQDINRSSVARILAGMDLSEEREPSEETALQRPEVLLPGLTASPWWDVAEFPWLRELESAYGDIRAEFEAVGGLRAENSVRHPNSHLAAAGSWNAYYFYMLGDTNAEHVKECPRTVRALSRADGVRDSGMCYFSVMAPRTHIEPHCGFINARIRCHLGLVIPDGATMRVGTETRRWSAGKAFLFDDSFEHEVWNDSDYGRAVLLFDVWHPELTNVEKRLLAHMMPVWKSRLYAANLT